MKNLHDIVNNLERIVAGDFTEEEQRLEWYGVDLLSAQFGQIHWLRAMLTPDGVIDGVEAEVEMADGNRMVFIDTLRQRIADSPRFGAAWEFISYDLAQELTDHLVSVYDELSTFLPEE